MFEHWKLRDFAPGEGRAAGAHTEPLDMNGWLPVDVPGDVHTALIAAGRIPHPFLDRNELECRWIEDREWWYRVNFDGPAEPLHADERLILVFDGLDTFATIWLNGVELGTSANMFREARFDVTPGLRMGTTNTLALCFDRPLDHAGDVIALPDSAWMPPRVAMRKAQFGYGWDWGPRLPTVGIWRPVHLRRQRGAVISGVDFCTCAIDQTSGHALVSVVVEAEQFNAGGPCSAVITLGAATGARPIAEQTITLSGAGTSLHGTAYMRVESPRLWWTHDLGDPALYCLEVCLMCQEATLDRVVRQVGIRTLTLDQSPDQEEPGTRFFRFVLNGVSIFARGTNWIPADSFVGAIGPDRYRRLLTLARDGNNTMLRVWGGGIYEHDAFYDECDRLGMLVWQDFMFACAAYPEDDAMAHEVDAEARYQIRRLRTHPSLALWCGNNENQWIHGMRHWQQPDLPTPGDLYYGTVLPRAVAELDGHTAYWPGSPFGGSDHNSMDDGDRHNWDVWHGQRPRRFGEQPPGDHTPEGVSYLNYAWDMGRFISEFGMHAAPVYETLRRNIPADQLFHHSPAMDHHNKDNPKDKGDNLMMATTGLPRDLGEYIDFSMMAQAEGLKFGVEHYRRRFPHCAGSLVWQLNDCWPVLSWSVVDYYGFGKAGYYYLKRAYAPIIATFKVLDDGGVQLWITNNSLSPAEDTIAVRHGAFAGETDWERSLTIAVPSAASRVVQQWHAGELHGVARSVYGRILALGPISE